MAWSQSPFNGSYLGACDAVTFVSHHPCWPPAGPLNHREHDLHPTQTQQASPSGASSAPQAVTAGKQEAARDRTVQKAVLPAAAVKDRGWLEAAWPASPTSLYGWINSFYQRRGCRNSPVWGVKKKSGEWRMMWDLRGVNETMKPQGAALPT